MALHLNGNQKQYRYSPHIINIAVSIFMTCKSYHEKVRHSRLLILPSTKIMHEIVRPFKVKEGFGPSVYTLCPNRTVIGGKSVDSDSMSGHLMMDKIKLKMT